MCFCRRLTIGFFFEQKIKLEVLDMFLVILKSRTGRNFKTISVFAQITDRQKSKVSSGLGAEQTQYTEQYTVCSQYTQHFWFFFQPARLRSVVFSTFVILFVPFSTWYKTVELKVSQVLQNYNSDLPVFI